MDNEICPTCGVVELIQGESECPDCAWETKWEKEYEESNHA